MSTLEIMTKQSETDAPIFRTIDSGPFAGTRIQPAPQDFVSDRASFEYMASDDDPLGDTILIEGNRYTISPRALGSLTKLLTLKPPTWFLKHFDAPTRDKMTRELVESLGKLDVRVFWKDTENGPRVLNFLDARKPILSDETCLSILSEVVERDDYGVKIHNQEYTDGGLMLQFYYDNGFDLGERYSAEREAAVQSDVNFFGATVRNSQLGFFSPDLSGYSFRPTCSNGAITSEFVDAWSRRDRDEAMSVEDLRDWYRVELANILGKRDELIERAQIAMNKRAPMTLLNDTVAEHKLSGTIIRWVYEALTKEPGTRQWEDGETGTSVWHVAQAFTRAAHAGGFDAPTRTKLERIGGVLVYG